ncbi:mitochondrial precursor protein import receptor tom70 [Sporothrix brasiliensis 5110]|uniref:Mitochondrial protein import receptor tom70 n=1 Tax=Sporothrix brasiliensis 5110 TaxID=1398154 RepID=A0A0C2IBW9_9PEZI|nr:mitochondrial precursor protein import receptor tom70 [Sporothrix brasiliensis 5110]KIH86771.1 mitochondrial precursor protein import receptor tom70 [Sporothrix brasiliensis 5110]
MAARPPIASPVAAVPPFPTGAAINVNVPENSSVWDRLTTWASENKAAVYTIAGIAVVVTGAGVVYYSKKAAAQEATPKLSKKERRKRKEAERKAAAEGKSASATESDDSSSKKTTAASVAPAAEEELPEITEASVGAMSLDERKKMALKLKEAGNKAYGAKDLDRAIDLYSKAILCKQDPVYYSNRAACYSALNNWEKVVEDTTAAINIDAEYIKALNRRANAYDRLGKYSESLLDYTASCIIDGFKNEASAQAVERLLKKFAETRAKEIMETRSAKLPSPTFVGNYLQSFRPKPRPAGLDDDADLAENSGKGQLRLGLQSLDKKTADGYEEASAAFSKAVALGNLGEFDALAYNLVGTFACLLGKHEEALTALTKSIELDPSMTQSYIKRASMNLELGAPSMAEEDFTKALAQNKDDPDIYYHRAQLHFIKSEFGEAAKDYQKSIDLDRDFIFSHIQLGVTQYKLGSIASSMATFRRCEKNFTKVPDVYNYHGELLLDQGRYQDAIEKFDKAIEMEKETKPMNMNVLPLINKSLAVFQWKQDFSEAEKLCSKALIIDPECDIAVATMAQLLLQQGKVTDALTYFERAADLARTEGELVNALSYAEATRTQIHVQEKYPALAAKLQGMGSVMR